MVMQTENTQYQKILQQAFAESQKQKIDPNITFSSILSQEEFNKLKQRVIKPYSYSSRFMQILIDSHPEQNIGLAYFSPEGILMKLLASESFHPYCKAHGIVRGTDWSFARLGANAVSVGAKRVIPLQSIGKENYHHNLSELAIYFSPITLQAPDMSQISYGGIALFRPASEADPICASMIHAMTLDVEVHMHMTRTLHSVFSTMGIGMLCFDISQLTGTISISYHNREVFKVLGLPDKDISFVNAECIFDPGEANAKLWEIIHTMQTVEKFPITLSVCGKKGEFIITTDVYNQPGLRVVGIRLYVTTPHYDAQQVANKIGGNALMTIDELVGESSTFQRTISQLKLCAKSGANVLLLGESGVGKDIIAQAIHNASDRRNRPFIAVNCASLPRDLIASELFGYEEGAFTGAKRSGNIGKFELANTGTIFLDEIGDMPLESQAMLLRVIEQKSFMRIGSNRVTNVDVKIISATNADLEELVEKKLFRLDLYYRLGVIKLHIPPLRQREDDVILLANHFIHAIEKREHAPKGRSVTLSPDAKELLRRLPWRGNVRELQNTIEGIMVLYQPAIIEAEHFRAYLNLTNETLREDPVQAPTDAPAFKEYVKVLPKKLTRDVLAQALAENRYNKSATAEMLGISRKSLYRKLEEFGLS